PGLVGHVQKEECYVFYSQRSIAGPLAHSIIPDLRFCAGFLRATSPDGGPSNTLQITFHCVASRPRIPSWRHGDGAQFVQPHSTPCSSYVASYADCIAAGSHRAARNAANADVSVPRVTG